MKVTKFSVSLVCLVAGLVLYPFGWRLSELAAERDSYPNLNPWHFDAFHSLVVPLPVAIPAMLVLVGCGLSLQVLIATARMEGWKALLRIKAVHLWGAVLLLIYIVLAFVVVL